MSKFVTAAAMIGSLAMTAPVLAQGVSQPAVYKGNLSAFHGNDRSLIGALDALQQSTGGKVVEIRFSDRNSAPGYDVVLERGREVTFMHLDMQGGNELQLQAVSAPAWMMKWTQRQDVKDVRKAPVPLDRAIVVAERANADAPAVAAGIAPSASNPDSDVKAYNVLLDVSGRAKRVAVDSSTGQVIADPQALSGWPD